MTQPGNQTLTVFYDGDCPLCRREIAFFRRREIPGKVNWVNLAVAEDASLGSDLNHCDAMTRFTVRKPDGKLLHGAAAFAALWRVTPGFGWLGQLAQFPPAGFALDVWYRLFLKIRPTLQSHAHRWESK